MQPNTSINVNKTPKLFQQQQNAAEILALQDPLGFFKKNYLSCSHVALCCKVIKENEDIALWLTKQKGYKPESMLIECVKYWPSTIEVILPSLNHAIHSKIVCQIIESNEDHAFLINDLAENDVLKFYSIEDILLAMAVHKSSVDFVLDMASKLPHRSARYFHVLANCARHHIDIGLELLNQHPNSHLLITTVLQTNKPYAIEFCKQRFIKHEYLAISCKAHVEIAREHVNSKDINVLTAIISHPSLLPLVMNRKYLGERNKARLIASNQDAAAFCNNESH